MALLAWRMTIGVDLSDESYYASFIDGWLKDGLSGSSNIVLHQLAALLVYPTAWLYTAAVGSERGLVLFLRFVFLAMACVAAFCQFRLVRRVRDAPVAWASALLVLSFIPFSLPAPSYNTIGMFGMLCALALFGTADAVLSGVAWMVAVIAYPTMSVALLAFLALAAFAARGGGGERRALLRYALICGFFQLCGAGLLLSVYGAARLWRMFWFTRTVMENPEYMGAKLARSLDVFAAHPGFSALCVAAVALGVWLLTVGHDRRRGMWPCLVVLAIVVAAYAMPTALWFPPHDIVVLLALVGVSALREDRPVIGVIYAASLVAGLITSVTSSNGIYNFPVGGLEAAALAPAMLVPRGAPWRSVAVQCGTMLTAVALFCTSAFVDLYGESANPLSTRAVRIGDDAFAGLLTTADQAAFIEAATAELGELTGRGGTILALGRPPGIYLLTDASPMTLSSWDFWQFYGSLPPRIEALTKAFYRDRAHRPDVIAVYSDPRTYPLAPWASDLLTHYRAAGHVAVGSRSVAFYVHCPAAGCAAR